MIAGERVTATGMEGTVIGFWAGMAIILWDGGKRPKFHTTDEFNRTGRMAWRVEKVRRKQ